MCSSFDFLKLFLKLIFYLFLNVVCAESLLQGTGFLQLWYTGLAALRHVGS